ncbi:DNA polymerase subunit Cdc27-domain-containing protein [Naematelia encephala]|uniref:DNA polymerase delta subunit 3 n=1 Tax=Naematelia encephala TaxID=71784 RepID=A0A1Y2AMX4_9TREE|nr:DNA polymerase subunit Cdc27-domain-containing protein [Naematelia encephala]
MPVPDHQATANRKLTQWLTNERRVVTYRDLSRELRCHVNVAKNLLRSYTLQQQTSSSSKSEGIMTATYLLTGPLKATAQLSKTALDSLSSQAGPATQMVRIVDMDEISDGERNSEDGDGQDDELGIGTERMGNDEGDQDGINGGVGVELQGIKREDEEVIGEQVVQRWGCVLVQQDNLDEKKTLFEDDKVCVTIYSLSPVPIKDPAQYLVPILALRSHERYRDPATYGTITGSAFNAAAEGGEKKIMRDGGIDFSKGAVKVARGGSKSEEGKKPQVKKDLFPSPVPAPNPELEIPKPKPEPAAKEKPKPSSSTNARKRDTASDDEVASTQNLGVKSDPVVEPTSSMNRADDKAAMEAMMGMDDDLDMDLGDKQEQEQEQEPEPQASGSKIQAKAHKHVKKEHGVRKKRKVKKSKTEVDEKGYMVTKDYYSEESYSGESEPDKESQNKFRKSTKATLEETHRATTTTIKSAPPPPKKPATPAAGKGGSSGTGGGSSMGKGRGGQMSLQGFFKKK